MSHALGVVLPLAVAIAVFPVPIIAVVLMVGSDRGRAKAWHSSLPGVWTDRGRCSRARARRGAIDAFTIAKSGAAGFALSALNPKNVLLVIAAAVEIGAFGLATTDEITVLLVFVVIASVGVLTPLVLATSLGDWSQEPLERMRGWMALNNATIMAVLFLIIGAKLIGDAIVAFFG